MSSVSNYKQKSLLGSRKGNFSVASVGLTTMLLTSGNAVAIDVDAGDYTALPAGTNLGMVYYQYATADSLYSDGDKAPINAGLDSQV